MLLQRAIKNGVFSIVTQIVSLVLSLLFAGMTIRYLGNARAGFFMTAGMFLGWIAVAGVGGFRAAAVHRLAVLSAHQDWAASRAVLGTVLSANLALALLLALASVAAFPYLFSWSRLDTAFRNDAWWVVVLGAVGFVVDQGAATLRVLYGAHQRFDVITYTSFAFGLVGNLVRLFVLIRYRTMASVALVNVTVSCAWLMFDLAMTRRLLKGWVLPLWQRAEFRPLVKFGLWAWSGDTVGAIANNLGTLVINYHLGSAPLPYIVYPQRIVGQIHSFFANCSYFLFPTFAAQGEKSVGDIARVEDRLRWFVAAGGWPIYVALILAGPALLTLLAGQEFARHAYPPLVVFCVLFAVNAQNIVYSFSTYAIGRIQASVVAENSASLLTVLSNLILIPWLGYMGVCWANMWKVPAVLLQSIWSRRLLGLPRSLQAEWAPYVSPFFGVVAWFVVAGLAKVFGGAGSVLTLLLSLVGGGVAYCVVVWHLETHVCASARRWETVARASGLLRGRVTCLARKAHPRASKECGTIDLQIGQDF
jgi:O-antigen/teichoic acid export membrane protein